MNKSPKRRLKRKYKIMFTILLTLISFPIITNIVEANELEYKKIADMCDLAKNHTCSYYEIRQFQLHGN